MTLTQHFLANLRAAVRLAILAAFHVAHAIVPCKWTAHKTWGIGLPADAGQEGGDHA